MPEDCEAGTYNDLQLQVIRHFECDWGRFLRAVQNPAEILQFVLDSHCGGDEKAFAAWFAEKGLPDDWMQRFRIAQLNLALEGAVDAPAESAEAAGATEPDDSKD